MEDEGGQRVGDGAAKKVAVEITNWNYGRRKAAHVSKLRVES